MFNKFFAMFAFIALATSPAYAVDWGFDEYDTYDGGYYDNTTSELYDYDDDWFYDSYTVGAEAEEEDEGAWDNSYGWESDDDLFSDDI